MAFPLENNQLGYISIKLQNFLKFKNSDICYTSSGNTINAKLKKNKSCLLRLGIERNSSQSFLYILASVYEFYDKPINNGIPTKTIQDFKNYFLSGLTIDKFVSCQNGILPQLFEREKLEKK